MTTQKERDVYEEATLLIIAEAAGENYAARDYLWKLACVSRTVDDIYDQDQELTRERLLRVVEYLFVEMPYNPFFQQYRDTLESEHVSMYNAWMAANHWADGDETDQIYSHVWRDSIHEVVPIVALLTQGQDKMDSNITRRC